MEKLKLVELLKEDGKFYREFQSANNFKDPIAKPVLQYLTFHLGRAEKYNIEKDKISIKNIANQLSRNLHVYELEPSNKSKYKDFSLGQLQNTLQELEEKENIFNRKKIRKEYLKISDLIDNYINLQKNINNSKVEVECPEQASKIAQKAEKILKSEYGKLDQNKINLDLGIVYFGFGNPHAHAMNAVLGGKNPTKFNDWNLVEPQSDGRK